MFVKEKDLEIWKSWPQVNQLATGRRLFLYGRSEDWVHKALPKLAQPPSGIIDRERNYHGSLYQGLLVMPLEEVDLGSRPFFLITAGEFSGIVSTLLELGLRPGNDFVCSPDFRDYASLQALNQVDDQLLVSSSDYLDVNRARGSQSGGGLFTVNTLNRSFKRVAKGSYRQFEILENGNIVALEFVEKRIDFFDQDFVLIHSLNLKKPNYCGLAVSEDRNLLSIINAGTDEIESFDLDTLSHRESRVFASDSLGRGHHLNDCTYGNDGTLYCSFFSFSGSFKLGNFDGGVATINPLNYEDPKLLMGDLWKPHSPKIINEEIFVLDSMRGKLRRGVSDAGWTFPGFVRGLDEKNGVFVIGQSEDMYVTERNQLEPTMVTSGIHLLDSDSNIYRMITTAGVMNIHQVRFL